MKPMREMMGLLLIVLLPWAGLAEGQSRGPQDGTAPPGHSLRMAALNKRKICAALCAYAGATGYFTGGQDAAGNPIPKHAKRAAAGKLVADMKPLLGPSKKLRKGKCKCPTPAGTKELSYAMRHTSSGDSQVTAKADLVIAIATDKSGTTPGNPATATNTGSGDAIAWGGWCDGSADGGAATAQTSSGDAYAFGGSSLGGGSGGKAKTTAGSGDAASAGGGSSGTNTGGSGEATTTTGCATSLGGAGGEAGGSPTRAGGAAGTVTATRGADTQHTAGETPVPAGHHGEGSNAWVTAGSSGVHAGAHTPN